MRLTPLAVALGLVLWPSGRAPLGADDPRVDVGSVEKLEVTALTRERISLWARAVLPQAARGSKQSFQGQVALANVPLPVRSPVPVAVQSASGRHEAVFFLDLDLQKTPEALLTHVGTHALDLTLKGTLSGEGGTSASICAVGVLRLGTPDVRAPGSFASSFFRFGGARLTGVTFSETSGEAVAILYNPFGFAVPMKDLTYSLYAGDRLLCSGERHGVRIHPSRENEIALPATARNGDLIAVAGSTIVSGGEFTGRLVASITFRIGRGEVRVPVDLPGTIRVIR